MRFLSKAQNYVVVLKNGISGNMNEGKAFVPTHKVKFEGGLAFVNSDETIALLKSHPGYGRDFKSEDDIADPSEFIGKFKKEPVHEIQEIHNGAVTAVHRDNSLTQQQEDALRLAKAMLPDLVKASLGELLPGIIEKVRAEEQSKLSASQPQPSAVKDAPDPKIAKASKSKAVTATEQAPVA